MQIIYAIIVGLFFFLPSIVFRVVGSIFLLFVILSILTGTPFWFRIN